MRNPLAAMLAVLLLSLVQCSGAPPGDALLAAPSVDAAPQLRGVADPDDDPAVVLLTIGGRPWCSGTLVASDVVLTARRCVSITHGDDSACPRRGLVEDDLRDLGTIHVRVGGDPATALDRARGRDVLLPDEVDLCTADVALLLLDTTIDDVVPARVSPVGLARGDRVRTAAFSVSSKRVRDHVEVAESSGRAVVVSEAPCVTLPGGAVIDETSGDLFGVVSHGDPRCSSTPPGWEVAVRTDAFLSLVERALARGHVHHQSHQLHELKGPIDQGAACFHGDDCAAGTCVTYAGAQYCSRSCSPVDRCPTKSRCLATAQSTTVCVAE